MRLEPQSGPEGHGTTQGSNGPDAKQESKE